MIIVNLLIFYFNVNFLIRKWVYVFVVIKVRCKISVNIWVIIKVLIVLWIFYKIDIF